MGFVRDVGGFFTGETAADAASDSAKLGAEAGDKSIEFQREALGDLRGDLAPFKEFGVDQGVGQLPGLFSQLQGAISDPSSAVIDNPFFKALAGQQEQRLLASQAARGKVGSGETGDELQRNLLLLGNQFQQQNIGNIQGQIQNQFNAATIGQNAAAQTGTAGLQTAQNIGGILGNVANIRGAAEVAGANATNQGISNILNTGGSIAGMLGFSDQRLKENIKFSHIDDGIRMYTWDWTEEAKELVGSQESQGPIAQELMLTRPDLVITDPETGFYKVLM